jgi:NDP-sugar pyrophosphorylase family protein
MIVIMAGGRGKRMRPLTDATPKPLLKVNDKPMLEWIIKRFTDQGFKEFAISVGYLGEQIEGYFKDGSGFGCSITYLRESSPLGTAGALSLLPKKKKPVIVINGDVLTSANFNDLLKYHISRNASATIGATSHRVDIPFGVLNVKDYRLQNIEEKPTYSYPIAAGVYVISPPALEGVRGAMDMPEFMSSLDNVHVFPISGEWQDVGRPEDLECVHTQSRM